MLRGSGASAVLVTLLAAGCGNAPLELPAHELRFVPESMVMPSGRRVTGGPALVMRPDGTLVLGTDVQGRVRPDGALLNPSGGPVGSVDGDGRVMLKDQDTGATIDRDGTLHLEGTSDVIRVSPTGEVSGSHAEAPRIRVEGLTDGTRRTAMAVIVMGWLGSESGRVSVGRANNR